MSDENNKTLFRKKPVVVEAVQWFPGNGCPGVMNDHPADAANKSLCGCMVIGGPSAPHVHTAHNRQAVLVEPGDWIIPEPEGRGYYPCKPDIFETTYEAAPPAVGEPETGELMRMVEELEKIDSALPMNWHRSYFVDSPRYRRWTEEEKRKAHESERRRIVAGGRVGESSCNAIAYVQTDDRDLIDRIVAVRNHLPTLLSAIRRLTAGNAELVKERDLAREAVVYLPGTLKCDACDFTLTKSIINAQTGEVDVDPDKAPEACPNDGTLLRRVSYREAFRDACDIGMKHAQEARQLEADLSATREEAKRLREALEPFVRAFMYVHRDPHADENDPGFREFLDGNEVIPRQMSSEEVLSVGHFRRAALAMESAAPSAPAGSQQEGKA